MSARIPRDKARAQRMADLYRQGKTLQEIGTEFGMTRERVRQLISYFGVNRKHGGQRIKTKRNDISRRAKLDEKSLAKWGCTHAQHQWLLSLKKPTRLFTMQRGNARTRGVAWNLTLWQWWTIWQESGKWAQRGRGQNKYCMARKGDIGPYEVGNVFICLCVENNSNRPQKKSGLPTGVTKRVVKNYVAFVANKMIGGKTYHIGSFKTPDAAAQAYQSFTA